MYFRHLRVCPSRLKPVLICLCAVFLGGTPISADFSGGDTQSEEFRELIVRWFQYGVFSPVMRLHGNRNRHGEKSNLKEPSGDPNELWSFGERIFEILKNLVFLRERLRPYIEHHMKIASEKGYPVMRPMFFDFPDDKECYTLGEQYMFGDDILFAPIVNRGQTKKTVYLPEGEWILTRIKRNTARVIILLQQKLMNLLHLSERVQRL